MEIVYFTAAAVLLYLASDWILQWLERKRGSRYEQRTLIFFGILLSFALVSFALIRSLAT